MNNPEIRDDTLRLVLSKGHDEWLRKELRDRHIALVLLAALIAVLAIATAISTGLTLTANDDLDNIRIVYVEENEKPEVIEALEDDGYVVLVRGTGPEFKQVAIPVWLSFVPVISIVLGFIAVPFVVKAILEVIKIRRWQRDHQAFLSAYNRGETKAPPPSN